MNNHPGVFKRAVDERKKTIKRTKLRRATQALSKRQCQTNVVDPNATAGTQQSAAPVASQVASQAPAATETAAVVASAAASQPAAAAPTSGSRLSDFTR